LFSGGSQNRGGATMSERGKVYLTGAGPGAADLLTVRAARVLARAEAVFHDALVSDEVLALCPPGCRIVPVGKRCGLPAPGRQETIHQLLAEAAAQHRTVVRLKGGDPCVFGRGGEELAFLIEHGIPWEVIPGISSGVGGLSALGLPLTHRDLASSVTLLTGSRALRGEFGGAGPFALSGAHTLVFYMGLRHVAAIADDLLRQGLDPSTYALCAARLSALDQKLVAAPLGRIGAEAAATGETPALLVVGDVVAFWKDLQAREGKP
jgi:uroporphyrin-III C-methyltransferase